MIYICERKKKKEKSSEKLYKPVGRSLKCRQANGREGKKKFSLIEKGSQNGLITSLLFLNFR